MKSNPHVDIIMAEVRAIAAAHNPNLAVNALFNLVCEILHDDAQWTKQETIDWFRVGVDGVWPLLDKRKKRGRGEMP